MMVNELGKLHTVNSEGMCISYDARLSMHCAVPLRSKTILVAGGRVVHGRPRVLFLIDRTPTAVTAPKDYVYVCTINVVCFNCSISRVDVMYSP